MQRVNVCLMGFPFKTVQIIMQKSLLKILEKTCMYVLHENFLVRYLKPDSTKKDFKKIQNICILKIHFSTHVV